MANDSFERTYNPIQLSIIKDVREIVLNGERRSSFNYEFDTQLLSLISILFYEDDRFALSEFVHKLCSYFDQVDITSDSIYEIDSKCMSGTPGQQKMYMSYPMHDDIYNSDDWTKSNVKQYVIALSDLKECFKYTSEEDIVRYLSAKKELLNIINNRATLLEKLPILKYKGLKKFLHLQQYNKVIDMFNEALRNYEDNEDVVRNYMDREHLFQYQCLIFFNLIEYLELL